MALPPLVTATGPLRYRLEAVALPAWAQDIGIGAERTLLVEASCLVPGDGPPHQRCDWLLAAYLHLDSWLERSVEQSSGPIQSYAARLPKEWASAYDRAWANRIFLFLRRWAAHERGKAEEALFQPLPKARFVLTHDVDALHKTFQLRIKSSLMSGIATLRHLAGARWRQAGRRVLNAVRYTATSSDYWLFDKICDEEATRGFRSSFMFADGRAASGFSGWLIDPSYAMIEPRLRAELARLRAGGWYIGVHPGFNSWRSPAALAATRRFVSEAAGTDVRIVRQHWLRFSFAETWAAQKQAGFTHDFTLGFNDRPGLRNGAALAWRPALPNGDEIGLTIMPTVLMDSHFYDYAFPDDPAMAMRPWIDEVVAVRGEASLLWHTQTMHADYGWGPGYLALLDMVKDSGADVTGPTA